MGIKTAVILYVLQSARSMADVSWPVNMARPAWLVESPGSVCSSCRARHVQHGRKSSKSCRTPLLSATVTDWYDVLLQSISMYNALQKNWKFSKWRWHLYYPTHSAQSLRALW